MLAAGGLWAARSVTTPATLPAPADNLHDLPSEPCPCLERKAPRRLERRGRARDASAQPSTTPARHSRAKACTGRQPETRTTSNPKLMIASLGVTDRIVQPGG